jgi:protein ImuA
MAKPAAAQAELSRLRRDIARIEGRLAQSERIDWDVAGARHKGSGGAGAPDALLPLDSGALDALLGGGLALARLHEVRTAETRDGGAALGFVLALAARFVRVRGATPIVFVSEAEARHEAGPLYGPGLAALGLDPGLLVEVAARSESEALWAFEATLASRGVGLAVCELRGTSLDLSATRRAALRASETGVTGVLLRLASPPEPSAAEERFRVTPAPAASIGGYAAGIGRMSWRLILEKNRAGRSGAVTVEWNAHERSFVAGGASGAYSEPLPAAPRHRSPAPTGGESRHHLRRAS